MSKIFSYSFTRSYFKYVFSALILIILILQPFFLPPFWTCLATEILIMGLAGMSVNLLLGYGGSLPFGHAAFYATGAYATAILIQKAGFHPFFAFLCAPFFAAIIGGVFGLVIARLYRFYYAMISLAFSMLLWTIIRKWSSMTGGDDGLTGVDTIPILTGINNSYYFALIVVFISIALLWIIINSPFGWTMRAIRENPVRCTFTSISVVRHRYVAFVISAFFTGVAGALFVIYSHSTFPDYAYWVKSGDFVAIVILGGMFALLGPMIGACIWILLHTILTASTVYWLIFMGIFICAVVLLMPEGVAGLYAKIRNQYTLKYPFLELSGLAKKEP